MQFRIQLFGPHILTDIKHTIDRVIIIGQIQGP